jgi:hypothetical protein
MHLDLPISEVLRLQIGQGINGEVLLLDAVAFIDADYTHHLTGAADVLLHRQSTRDPRDVLCEQGEMMRIIMRLCV